MVFVNRLQLGSWSLMHAQKLKLSSMHLFNDIRDYSMKRSLKCKDSIQACITPFASLQLPSAKLSIWTAIKRLFLWNSLVIILHTRHSDFFRFVQIHLCCTWPNAVDASRQQVQTSILHCCSSCQCHLISRVFEQSKNDNNIVDNGRLSPADNSTSDNCPLRNSSFPFFKNRWFERF